MSLFGTCTHLVPHLGLAVCQSEMLARWWAGEGGQGRKGSQVPQTSIKMTGTPALKLPDPPQNLNLPPLCRQTHMWKHTHTEIPGLESSPAAKETSSP